jgi:hypothetical protein
VLVEDPDGTRARQKTGCPIAPNSAITSDIRRYKDSAQLKANKLEADDYKDYNPHQNRPNQSLYLFNKLMLQFIEECRPGPAHLNCIKHLYRFFSGFCLYELEGSIGHKLVDADAITAYKSFRASTMFRGKAAATSTIRRELATFSSAINHARFEWN